MGLLDKIRWWRRTDPPPTEVQVSPFAETFYDLPDNHLLSTAPPPPAHPTWDGSTLLLAGQLPFRSRADDMRDQLPWRVVN